MIFDNAPDPAGFNGIPAGLNGIPAGFNGIPSGGNLHTMKTFKEYEKIYENRWNSKNIMEISENWWKSMKMMENVWRTSEINKIMKIDKNCRKTWKIRIRVKIRCGMLF